MKEKGIICVLICLCILVFIVLGIAAGPGDRLLVSLGNGNLVKLYSPDNNNWASFASIPKGSALVASRYAGNSLQVYVAVSSVSVGCTKILAYSTDGQVIVFIF